ncbi:electron transfer flavoprotein subunit beta/FixA family protein [Clostridium scatologenes]|uniref:Electron transfer flavoprotein small subunit n=1 Tax=Clostridium scatologenes TaxID=1548 RepID=A0A0E3M6Q5_CLOSL|nr:electron transfer flavoprotein subunit beta/FixA family protein [Clostridium scatologenes]AKA69478.1 electron transfer flavoprotein subunit beta [Clostridium scatologenes]
MKIIVLIKEVPDMEKVKFNREKGIVDRSSAEAEINPFDLNALQTAVDLKNKFGGEVIVITMGLPRSEKSLRDAYARGADKGILLTDKKFGGADTWATAYTLAAEIKKIKDYDLIISGEKSVDGDTAQVGAEVAEFLNIPHSYYVEKIGDISKDEIEVTIENLCGKKQNRKMKLPALVSVSKNINYPELPTLERKLESLKIEIEKYSLENLNEYIKEEEAGFNGSKTKVVKIVVPKEVKRESKIYKDNLNCYMEDVLHMMKNKNII